MFRWNKNMQRWNKNCESLACFPYFPNLWKIQFEIYENAGFYEIHDEDKSFKKLKSIVSFSRQSIVPIDCNLHCVRVHVIWLMLNYITVSRMNSSAVTKWLSNWVSCRLYKKYLGRSECPRKIANRSRS